jgi:RNA polymerase sigma-70 factor (ECF subfamily)
MEKEKEIRQEDESSMPDEEIVGLYWERDEKAIFHTDKKYGKFLFQISYNILQQELDCEECVNDTYLNAWNAIPPKRPSPLGAFLSRITRNLSVDRYRKQSAERRIPSELTVSLDEFGQEVAYSPSLEDEYLISEISKVINEYLHSLSSREWLIFICRYYYSDRISKIAEMLSVSERTVNRELAKMREGLRQKLLEGGVCIE